MRSFLTIRSRVSSNSSRGCMSFPSLWLVIYRGQLAIFDFPIFPSESMTFLEVFEHAKLDCLSEVSVLVSVDCALVTLTCPCSG